MKIIDKHWERFEKYIMPIPESGCWLWIGAICRKGYGRFGIGASKVFQAHRISYEYLKAEIPEGLELDHLCRVRCCVNPNHLEPVTGRINNERGISPPAKNIKKTFCPKGHPYSGENLVIDSRGYRQCLTCLTIKRKIAWQVKRGSSKKRGPHKPK